MDAKQCRVPIRWEGAQFSWHSLAHVNRELCLGLLETEKVELTIVPTDIPQFGPEEDPHFQQIAERVRAHLSSPAKVHVRHQFPPIFDPPNEGHFVLIQPWEYGTLPKHWIRSIQDSVAEVWCHSRYVKEVYQKSGIPANRLHIVPHGVNIKTFNPEAPPYIFTTEAGCRRAIQDLERRFRFLYAGGTIDRKGIDVLLNAYTKAFTPSDPVCLVVKDTCTRTAYQGMNQSQRILQLSEDPSCPPIIYLDDDLSANQLAGIYNACDILVQPYRGEGFCLPALEAMACGKPVMATEGGATDDFIDVSVGWRIPAKRKYLKDRRVSDWECVDKPWLLEPSEEKLIELLVYAFDHREEVKAKGIVAAKRVADGWTWKIACAKAMERVEALNRKPLRRTVSRPAQGPSQVPDSKSAANSFTNPALPTEPTISLCMIVKNEERVFEACLRSAKPWFDEVIVVDTGSEDRTVEIAQAMGAQVHHFPWCDDFSAARNESLRYATGDWIFWMDADDTLPATSGEAIRRAALYATAETGGFVIPVQFVQIGAGAGTRVDHVKLFRHIPGLQFEGRIHEQILRGLTSRGWKIARSEAVVLHSGYDTSPEGQERKRIRDYHLLELDLKDRPDHPFVLFNLGMTDHYCSQHEAAINWLTKCIAVSGEGDTHIRKAYAMLAVSQRELGNLEDCISTLEEGLVVVPEDPELHFLLGLTLTTLNRLEDAKSHYMKVIGADITGHFSSVDIGILGYKSLHNLGSVCLSLGNYNEAKRYWLEAINDAPQFLPSAFELFDAALGQSDYGTAEEMLKFVVQSEGKTENWANMAVKLAEKRGMTGDGLVFLRGAVTTFPDAVGPRLVLARLLLRDGHVDEAHQHLLILSDQKVAEAAFYLGVYYIQHGQLRRALGSMELALALNPGHRDTEEQIANLTLALASG